MNYSCTDGKARALLIVLCVMVLTALSFAAIGKMKQIPNGQKAKVKGKITSRNGDLIYVTDVVDHSTIAIRLTESTKIERKAAKHTFLREPSLDVTAMLPGLTIEAEGVGNAKGQLDARTISFDPDTFATEVAGQRQSMANKAAASEAQSTTNQHASDLSDYKTVAAAGIYFASDSAALDDAAKADLDTLAAYLTSAPNYMIAVSAYASSTESNDARQKLSEERAAAVVNYLRQQGNVPLRRFLLPGGYSAGNPAAPNNDPQGRALDRRVDVKVIVNGGADKQ